ncbi:hypothetical protein IPH92_01430 [Candidatus Kaiserbacteria bacterium]|nr:MAG: hypothetical protein IPH92_01430 [Candidatus Kaiserbacteria bacterium]
MIFGGIALHSLIRRSAISAIIRYIASVSFLLLSIVTFFLLSNTLYASHADGTLSLLSSVLYGFISLQFYAYLVYLIIALIPTPATNNHSIINQDSFEGLGFNTKMRSALVYGGKVLIANVFSIKDHIKVVVFSIVQKNYQEHRLQ